jgi:hypothetical protein
MASLPSVPQKKENPRGVYDTCVCTRLPERSHRIRFRYSSGRRAIATVLFTAGLHVGIKQSKNLTSYIKRNTCLELSSLNSLTRDVDRLHLRSVSECPPPDFSPSSLQLCERECYRSGQDKTPSRQKRNGSPVTLNIGDAI